MKSKFIIVLFIVFIITVALIHADLTTKTRNRISKLSAELETTQEKLDSLKTSEAIKLDKVNQLKRRISSLKIKIYNLNKEKEDTHKNINNIKDKIQDYSTNISDNKILINELAYNLLDFSYSSKNSDNLKNVHQLMLLKNYTKNIMANLDTLTVFYQASLGKETKEKKKLEQIIETTRKSKHKYSHSSTIKDKELQALTLLKKDEMKIEKDINSVKTSLSNLEKLIQQYEAKNKTSVSPQNFKQNLSWPAQGNILQYYGKESFNGNKTTIFNKGVIIETAENSPVKAIAKGVVAFAQWFEKKGKLVIIDHQNGFYSLYGFNKKLLVKKGQNINNGQVIALSGKNPVLEQYCLYFEFRKLGKTVDPLQYLPPRS